MRKQQDEPKFDEDRLEASYEFTRDYPSHASPSLYPKQTVLAYVSANRDELAEEFIGWVYESSREVAEESLLWWEDARFGRRLEPAAHGMLLFRVSSLTAQATQKRLRDRHWETDAERIKYQSLVQENPPHHKELAGAYLRRLVGLHGQPEKPLVKPMPEVRLPYKDPADPPEVLTPVVAEPQESDLDWLEGDEE